MVHSHYHDSGRAKEAARRVLADFGCRNPPVNPLDIAEKCGIGVFFVSFPSNPDVSGFYDPEERRIYVNSRDGTRRQAFTIAHELGHAILHKEWARSNDYRVLMRGTDAEENTLEEEEANSFAANLLVPGDMLIRFAETMSLKKLFEIFMVPERVLGYRIADEFP